MNARWGSGAGREGRNDSIIRFLSSESQRDTLEAVVEYSFNWHALSVSHKYLGKDRSDLSDSLEAEYIYST